MNKFEKISFSQFLTDYEDEFGADTGEYGEFYKDIKIPKRATKYSAGYDFYAPFGFTLESGQTIKIPTGIKCSLDKDKFLAIVPRSSLGFKYRIQLDNTVGIIDSDYYNNEKNEGHIFIKITNDSKTEKTLIVRRGEAFAQGIILPFFVIEDDKTTNERKGGIGSTSK